MLPLLYFPDEHVYAVYVPLLFASTPNSSTAQHQAASHSISLSRYAPFFLPVIVPVFGALLASFKDFKKRKANEKIA
jgi:hypothetical protein